MNKKSYISEIPLPLELLGPWRPSNDLHVPPLVGQSPLSRIVTVCVIVERGIDKFSKSQEFPEPSKFPSSL